MSGDNIFERLVRRADDALSFISDNFRYISFIILFLLIFFIGFAAGTITNNQNANPQKQVAAESVKSDLLTYVPFNSATTEKSSPFDRIKESQIHVYNDRITIDLKDAEWATFTDTNSMDPVIDFGANAIEIVPKTSDDVSVGDIVSYKSEYSSGTIIHRIVETGTDKDGWYCRTKGDNNKDIDPGKIRFPQIQRVVVAVIY